MRLDGYIRVSRVGGREGDSFISPDVQREQIASWAKLRGVEIAAWQTDLDQSGGKLSRPGLDAIMSRVRSGETGGIVVAKLDRLSRAGVADALNLVEEISDHGGQVAAVDLGIDPTTPFGEFGLTIMLALARMERRRITENWAYARARANKRGVYQARAPFGYDKGEDGRLVPNEDAAHVREIYARRSRGTTWQDIARWLNDEGVKPPDSKQWVRGTVKDLAANKAYLGIAYHGEYVNESAHEPLVTRALFEAAKGKAFNPTQGKQPNLLSGIMRCAGCSYCLSPGMTGSPGKRTRQYWCKKKHGSGTCPTGGSIRAEPLESWVVEQFFSYIDTPVFEGAEQQGDYDALSQRLEQAQARLDELAQDVEAREVMGRETWLSAIRSHKDAVALAERACDDCRRKAAGVSVPVADLREYWSKLSTDEQRTILRQTIDAIMVRNVGRGNVVPVEERVRILWRGQAPADLPRQGQKASIREFVFAPDFAPDDIGVPLA
ncbi:recombinase family protein [Candidatus Solirubrobacter pratensis]|uniref:recombinase family protein n=1 Tax=Candidatus Solirubrobacter pratensis TaxID=1298857 RepID=UPI00047FB299|nr:recombinase family protein [Candidatus Solirubrobacter pratensis]